MPNFLIQTFGCQMNYSDSERMETYLLALGYNKTADPHKADLIIFNSCSVRQKAEDRILGQMGTMEAFKKKNKKLILLLTGCMVRISSSRYSTKRDKVFNRAREIDIALRIDELPKLSSLIKEVNPRIKLKSIPEESLENYFKIKPNYTSTFQAFIPVSTGCDKFCTYCIVPFSRGREKSRPLKDILTEVKELVDKGCLEITLIGQTVNSYGLSNYDKYHSYNSRTKNFNGVPKDRQPFAYLLEQIDKLQKKGLQRVRFTSSHPKDICDDLINVMSKLKTQMPYLHLPVQSGDNAVLKRMNRTYTREQYVDIIKKLKKKIPGISISTDVIVGFCGETEKEFKNTLKLFKELEFDLAYPAQYSERSGTYASKNLKDDISAKTKKKRWNDINDVLRQTSYKNNKRFQGKVVNVLIEAIQKKKLLGKSEHSKIVEIKCSDKKLIGKIVPVKITKAKEWVLEGIISSPTAL